MKKIKPKRSIGTFNPPKNTMEMKTDTKRSHIRPTRKMYNFNSRRYRKSEKRMLRHLNGYGRRSLLERIFPKSGWFWDSTHNGVFGPGGHSTHKFEWGKLAVVLCLVIGGVCFIVLISLFASIGL